MWFFRSRDRFSLEELRHLNEQLQKVTVLNDSNKDFVVETLRSMAELLVWGDQHDPQFFEYFMEKQVMVHFMHLLNESRKYSSVAMQLLQSLNIIIGNIRSEYALYYLFSNGYVNTLITYSFDFRHEEVLAYYISFLRTISMKLDTSTVSFFIKTKDEDVVSFPLYSEAVKFFRHEEGMVRIAVRTITLNIFNVNDEGIQKFIMGPAVVGYFSDLVAFLRQQSVNLDGLVAEAARDSQSTATIGRLEAATAEIGDLLFYCNDIMGSGIPGLNDLMTKHLLNLLVKPVLVPALSGGEITRDGSTTSGVLQVSPLCSMYLISRLLHIVRRRPLVNLMSAALLQITQPTSAVHRVTSVSTDPSVDSNGADCSSRASGAEDVQVGEDDERYNDNSLGESGVVHNTEDTSTTSRDESPREALISYLDHEDDKLVLASLCVLVALLQNEGLDDMLLDALGILPRKKRQKHMLLQALVGSQSDGEPELFADPPRNTEEYMSLGFDKFRVGDVFDTKTVPNKQNGEVGSEGDSSAAKFRKNRQEVVDGLMQLLSRRPPPCAEALWHAGWMLRQLLPHNDLTLSSSRLANFDDAYAAARDKLSSEVENCWCDVIPSVLRDEWNVCRNALESPTLQKDSSFVLLPSNSDDGTAAGDLSSSVTGERMRAAVKVFVSLHQVRHLLSEGTWWGPLSLGNPDESDSALLQVGLQLTTVAVGDELNLTEGRAMSCRVAFERGRERSVLLMVAHKERDAASWLLLVEEVTSRQGHGVVRVIAPLAGSKPRVDGDHPRWLHLRIRSPHWPSADAGKLGTQGPRAKRLIDGRWTLAFSDEGSCQNAKTLVDNMCDIQSGLVRQILSPLLDSPLKSTES